MANFAEASAFPHGTSRPQVLKNGDVVLVDCGCTVEGYNSDISRTIVFGAEPTARQLEIWNLEKEAQAAGYRAAKIGATLGDVDAAARKVITDAGFGPDYKLPGLPHRTGHGIGMDGHEWGNAVRGNTQILEPGMCFSIEPNISIVGEFGIRHEDCVYMTESGRFGFLSPVPRFLSHLLRKFPRTKLPGFRLQGWGFASRFPLKKLYLRRLIIPHFHESIPCFTGRIY
ncbi:M24 family metallopeptidase [Algoriphagus boritolerans]|uniref:M24 family metallopeptidase n=1 Tax=Algoriphagus boritolerans TaxID=308111 RepID=UPI002FCE086A